MPLYPPQDYRNTSQIHRIGTAANRPAAANVLPGTLYFSTDTFVLERSDGTSWSNVGAGITSGTWTPVLTCVTPGDLSVTYNNQTGYYYRIGSYVYITFNIITTNMTQTTASGDVRLTGLPYTSANLSNVYHTGGLMQFQGITKATYTTFAPRIPPNVTYIDILAGGSGVNAAQVVIGDLTTGAGNLMFIGSISILV